MSGLRTRSACIVLMLAAMAPLLAGCNEPTAATARGKPAEPEVGIFTVRPQARAIVRELPGRIAPTRVSDVRARVSGIVVERLFQQGSEVKAGDPLYRIDPKPFEVELQASEAALDKAMAALDLAAQHARRIATLTSQRAAPEAENEKAIARPAPGRGRCRQPQGRRRARQAQSRLCHHPRADQRRRRRRAGQRRRAGGAERHHQPRHDPAARPDLRRLHPIGHRDEQAAPRVRQRRSRPDRARRGQGPPRARRRHGLSDSRQAAVLRSQGRCLYRAGDAARRVSQSEARIAAGHVCPRPDRAGHRYRRHRRAAAGDPARCRRRQRSVRGQGRRPRRDAAGPHRRGAGRRLAGQRGPEGRRPRRRRGVPEVRARRQGQGRRRGSKRMPRSVPVPGAPATQAPAEIGHAQLLHRQADLRLGRRAFHLPDRRDLDSAAGGRAISDHRAALDLDLDQLSRRVAGKPLQQRHAADRGGAQRRLRHPQFRIHQRLAGAGRDHRQFRARHRNRRGLGRSAEPPQARRGAAAARGDPAGHPGRGSLQRRAADHHAELDRRQPRRSRPRRFHDPQRARRNPAHSRRRPRHALFDRTFAADLDRSGQAGRLRPHRRRRQQGDHGAERAGRLGQHRRRAEHAGAEDFRAGAGQGPALLAGRIRRHHRCAPMPTVRPCGCATSPASRSAA